VPFITAIGGSRQFDPHDGSVLIWVVGTLRCDVTGRVQLAESGFRLWLRRSAAARTAQRAFPAKSGHCPHDRRGEPSS